MPRYSLAPEDAWHEEEDDKCTGTLEPPHPLGFGSQWGRTWIGLDPPARSLQLTSPGRSTYGLDVEDEDEFTFMTRAYPPLSSYLPAASTPVLLKLHHKLEEQRDDTINDKRRYYNQTDDQNDDDDMVALQQMLLRQTLTKFTPPAISTKPLPPDSTHRIAQFLSAEKQRMEKEHLAMNREIKNLIVELEQQATEREIAQRKHDEEQEAVLRQKKKELRDRQEKEKAAKQQIEAEQEAKAQESLRKREDAKRLEAAKTEYVAKAQKLVQQLVAVRQSIEPFDNNKAVAKRRLGMKKIIRGKINTLSENAAKIQEVAAEVSQAITEARSEDETIKQALERGDAGYTADMARGKRYLVDLLASNTIQRVQAEGFNGPRGDGFPLANMLAMVSVENKELVPILAAHIYTVCPTAIPTLPVAAPNASEEEFMEGLGMLKGKNGDFETFDRFLTRTESIVSMVSNIMASMPSSHLLLGGHNGAVEWLGRFLDLLPPPPTSPLPLLTAPVLHGFLAGAGHMLANKHSDAFRKYVQTITTDVLPRLDEGPIGKPSSIRLGKLMDGGFENFQSTLPPKALPELYYGANGTAPGHGGSATSAPTTTGASSFGKSSSNPFGNTSSSAPTNPFGASTRSGPTQKVVSNPFGSSSATSGASPFGGPPSNPFSSSSNAGFDSGKNGMPVESSVQSTSIPFGATLSGGSSFPTSSGFGGTSFGTSSKSPFGSGPASAAPFGSVGAAPAGTPFGATPPSFGGTNAGGFGSNTMNTALTSPFGSGSNTAAPLPFGGTSNAPAPSPFGTPSSAMGPSPFGGSFNAAPSSAFGGPSNPVAPSPFGSSGSSSFGGGSSTAFGAPRGNSSTSFGSTAGNSFGGGFGGNNNSATTGSTFGSTAPRSGKPPCKYFARGQCKFGASCKFSHETGGSSGNQGFGNSGPNNRGQGSSGPGGGGFGGRGGVGKSPFSSGFGSNSTSGFGALRG